MHVLGKFLLMAWHGAFGVRDRERVSFMKDF